MLTNYFKTAFRNLKKNRLFSMINILGLAIGMTACLLILHHVNFEKSYDRFHENSDRIYRLRYERTSEDGSAVRFASCCPPAGKLIRERYPEVGKVGRLLRYRAGVSYENIKFIEERMYFAEPDFLDILKFKFIEGDPLKGIAEPNKAFVSQSTAQKYFGDQSAIGKILSVDQKYDYQIVGIFADIPANSHIKFDILLPWKNLESQFGPEYTENWGHTGSYTYIRLKPNVVLPALEKKLQELVDKEFGEVLKRYNMVMELPLQPLTDIHLTSHYMQEYETNGDSASVYFLFIIAFFIIIMAWVNYVNLSTARALTRAKEVGLRKVVGASRTQIMMQFFLETIIVNIIAILLAAGLVQLIVPYFSHFAGTSMEFSIWSQHQIWIAIIYMFAIGVFLSGFYPVVALSSFEPTAVMKGKTGNSAKGINLRKALVVFQFMMALVLSTGTLAVYRQINFMKNRDLGFNIEQTLVAKMPRVRDDLFKEKIKTFKDELLNYSNIHKFCVVTEVPGRQLYWDAGAIMKAGEDISKSKNYQIVGMDYDFVDVFDLELVAGRNFSREFSTDKDALVFNETAVKWMGFESAETAVGQQVDYWGEIFTIVGVLKDYHQQSLKEAFEPNIYRLMPYGRDVRGVMAIKTNPQNIKETVQLVEQKYGEFFPGNPFEYFFLDEYFNQQYKADELFGRVFGVFAFLAIFVTSLGILGLSSFMAIQRTKEIGIRKVLGATVARILFLLTKDFLSLILISFILALPVTYLGVNFWLDFFANKMPLSFLLFVFPLIIIGIITIGTISYYVIKAAMSNPVEALRYE